MAVASPSARRSLSRSPITGRGAGGGSPEIRRLQASRGQFLERMGRVNTEIAAGNELGRTQAGVRDAQTRLRRMRAAEDPAEAASGAAAAAAEAASASARPTVPSFTSPSPLAVPASSSGGATGGLGGGAASVSSSGPASVAAAQAALPPTTTSVSTTTTTTPPAGVAGVSFGGPATATGSFRFAPMFDRPNVPVISLTGSAGSSALAPGTSAFASVAGPSDERTYRHTVPPFDAARYLPAHVPPPPMPTFGGSSDGAGAGRGEGVGLGPGSRSARTASATAATSAGAKATASGSGGDYQALSAWLATTTSGTRPAEAASGAPALVNVTGGGDHSGRTMDLSLSSGLATESARDAVIRHLRREVHALESRIDGVINAAETMVTTSLEDMRDDLTANQREIVRLQRESAAAHAELEAHRADRAFAEAKIRRFRRAW